jgi:hypothetical protein
MKQYKKPRIDKRAILPAVTAQILSEAASPPDNNEDGDDEGGVIT